MIDVSIIIVNYNVKHFVDQCLRSVFDASNDLNIEVFVVDNDSIDGSVEHIRKHFPQVQLVANTENVGFARANNQALKEAVGKYQLLLNPDTIIEKETLTRCFEYMESNEKCGALGVRMIDGEGKFLPESKRGFPTPLTSLSRLLGFSRLFPKSRFFNRYNLGYLNEHETHEVDVLSGAFMFMRKEALDKVGLLDEQFFMYGEDIDLSYRIQKGGNSIIYFPETSIVHFKGESTKKSSLKYYNTFYKAMAIFAKKHYGGRFFNPFLTLINTAIIAIAVFTYLFRIFRKSIYPIIEFGVFFAVLHLVEKLWAVYYYQNPSYYEDFDSLPLYLLYSISWVGGLWLTGSYRNTMNLKRLIGGLISGTVIILILYALMDNAMRHSRAIIILSSLLSLTMVFLLRALLSRLRGNRNVAIAKQSKVLVVGDQNAINKALEILKNSKGKKEFVGAVTPETIKVDDKHFIQYIDKLDQVVEVFKVTEVLFSTDVVPIGQIMDWMTKLGSKVKIKILSSDVQSIIGSHDRNTKGDLYTVELNYNINSDQNKAAKLFLDILLAILILLISPLLILISGKFKVLENLFSVFTGRKTWVAYISSDNKLDVLPGIRKGIVPPVAIAVIPKMTQQEIHSINFFYARDYSPRRDLEILLLNFKGILR